MSRCVAPSLLLLGFVSACGTSGAASEGTTPPGSSAAATVEGAGAPAAALDAEITKTAASAAVVEKMKVRLDGEGNVVKQSLYHGSADAIPEAVRKLAETRFPGAKVTGYETELYADRGRVYEVEVDTTDGKHCELAASPAAEELYTECEVDPATLSDAVKAAIDKAAPGGKLLEAETKKGPDLEEITVEVEAGGEEFYLRINTDGSLIQKLRRIPAVVEVPVP